MRAAGLLGAVDRSRDAVGLAGQAQNAADAAALAGGVALAYVEPGDTTRPQAAAQAVALQHSVWGEAVSAGLSGGRRGFVSGRLAGIPGDCLSGRDGSTAAESGSPQPVSSRGCSARAPPTYACFSQRQGHDRQCLELPAAAGDHGFVDLPASGTWQWDDRFAPPDVYVAPSSSGPGTGHTQASLNFRVSLGRGEVQFPVPPAGNEYLNLDISRVGSPGTEGDYAQREQRYLDNMATCNAVPVPIGEPVGYSGRGPRADECGGPEHRSTPTPEPTGTAPRFEGAPSR